MALWLYNGKLDLEPQLRQTANKMLLTSVVRYTLRRINPKEEKL